MDTARLMAHFVVKGEDYILDSYGVDVSLIAPVVEEVIDLGGNSTDAGQEMMCDK